jgi:hypothetical protein
MYGINNCTFVGCGVGIYLAGTSTISMNITNCLFIDNGVGGKAIQSLNGRSYHEDYNVCDHSLANSGFSGMHSVYGADLSGVLMDIANGDYSLNYGSANAIAYVIDKGAPHIVELDASQNVATIPTTIGAVLPWDFPARASVLSSDTIMGLDGTAEGGAGGGGNMIIGSGIIRGRK